MAKYKIEWMERKTTSTGKNKADGDITEVTTNKTIQGVTLWEASWPNFKDLAPGMEVEGDYQEKQNGQYHNKTLFPYRAPSVVGTGIKPGGFKKNIDAVMEKKQEGIRQSQENKELGIKTSSSIRLATDVAIAEGNPTTENIRKWRAWFWSEWDKEDKDFPPFNN